MSIFSHIFLSNYWWQKSDIWSQALYRYPISWEAFFYPSDSYFLFAEERGYHKWALAHNSSCSLCLQSVCETEATLFLMFTINLWNRGYIIPYVYNQYVKQATLFLIFTINMWNRGYFIPCVYNQSVKQRLRYSLCLQSICETEAMLFLMFTINLWNRGYVIPSVYNQFVKQRLHYSFVIFCTLGKLYCLCFGW
jgi:hypothetical protein